MSFPLMSKLITDAANYSLLQQRKAARLTQDEYDAQEAINREEIGEDYEEDRPLTPAELARCAALCKQK